MEMMFDLFDVEGTHVKSCIVKENLWKWWLRWYTKLINVGARAKSFFWVRSKAGGSGVTTALSWEWEIYEICEFSLGNIFLLVLTFGSLCASCHAQIPPFPDGCKDHTARSQWNHTRMGWEAILLSCLFTSRSHKWFPTSLTSKIG